MRPTPTALFNFETHSPLSPPAPPSTSDSTDRVQDTLLQNKATLHLEYVNLKEFEKTVEAGSSF